MKQDDKTLVERTTTLTIPADLVTKIVLEALSLPIGALVTSDRMGDFDMHEFEPTRGMRVTWNVREPLR